MITEKKNVLVTRPEHQAEHLCSLLIAANFQPIRYPTIEIQTTDHTPLTRTALEHSHQCDYLIFVSPNAVAQADHLLDNKWPPQQTNIIAIGPKTADKLTKIGLQPSIVATTPFNSESLLKLLPSSLKHKKGLIIKGEGGRTLLSEQLQQRGMDVTSVDVYQRALPSNSNQIGTKIPQYITITSQRALDNLFILLAKQTPELKKYAIFIVLSQRIAHYAEDLGCQHVVASQEASDMGLVSTIVNLHKP